MITYVGINIFLRTSFKINLVQSAPHRGKTHPELSEDWTFSSVNKFRRLVQGVGGRVKGTDTIFFINKSELPHDRFRDVTYGIFVCTVQLEKEEKNRTRLTVGGNRINYPDEVSTPTADMLLVKILFNSVISSKGAKFMTGDIKNCYLMTPLKQWEIFQTQAQ